MKKLPLTLIVTGLLFCTYGCLDAVKGAADETGQKLKTDEGRQKVGQDLQAAGATVSSIPHPYAVIGGSLISLVGTVLASHKVGKKSGVKAGLTTATRIVDALEQVKDEDGRVDFKDPQVVKELNRLLTLSDKKLIDEVQGK